MRCLKGSVSQQSLAILRRVEMRGRAPTSLAFGHSGAETLRRLPWTSLAEPPPRVFECARHNYSPWAIIWYENGTMWCGMDAEPYCEGDDTYLGA